MSILPYELRLAVALLLVALAFFASWRFVAHRVQTPGADPLADVLLLFFLIQYLSVGLPGVLRLLSPISIALTTITLSATLFFSSRGKPPRPVVLERVNSLDRYTFLVATSFALAYIVSISSVMSVAPVMANDPLTYHFPAAVHWLQSGRISLFQTWFFNPANTYSPLAGSTFIAWWIAPIGSDVLARIVQQPTVFLAYFALIRLGKCLGLRTAIACIAALALVVSQPFARQCFVEKDDLYVAAFFLAACAALSKDRLTDRLGPWRLGVGIGLFLATKYTALLAFPALLLAIDAPFRAGWRFKQWTIAIAVALLLAGPWFLRNLLMTGNPLYPIDFAGLNGMFSTARSTSFATLGSTWNVLTALDQSIPALLMIILMAGWIITAILHRSLANPLLRLALLGPPLMVAFFLLFSPYSEARFLYPALGLSMVTAALAFRPLAPSLALPIAAAALFLPSLFTGLATVNLANLAAPTIIITLLLVAGAILLDRFKRHRRRILASATAAATLFIAGWIYVDWRAHLLELYADVDDNNKPRISVLDYVYGGWYGDDTAEMWKFIRMNLPPDQTLAYANTFLVHPLTGPSHNRRIVYVPTRRNVRHLHDLPHLSGKLPGEQIVSTVADATVADPDPRQWLEKLAQSNASHIVIFKEGVVKNPPEFAIIRDNPTRFEQVFENPAAAIYRVKN